MDCQACKGKHVKHTCSKSRTYKKRKITKEDVVEDKMEEMEEEDEQDNNGDGTQCEEEMQSEEDNNDGDNEESEEEGAQDEDKVFQINEIIYARWNGNGLMYLAKIININDKIYSIMFMTDLKTKQVSKVHLDDIHKRIELKKNMLVSAIYKGKGDGYNHMFKARISSIDKYTVNVLWHDGEKNNRKVSKYYICPLEGFDDMAIKNPVLNEKVLALWGGLDNGYRFKGTIYKIFPEKLIIRWNDGGASYMETNYKDVNRLYEL